MRLGAAVFVHDVSETHRVDNVRRDFVANVSHELKTPIGALELLAETLAAESDPEVARPLIERLAKEAERLGRIVDDLLDLSLIETQDAATREVLDVDALVDEAADRLRPSAMVAGIGLAGRTTAATGARVECDRRQVVERARQPARQRGEVLGDGQGGRRSSTEHARATTSSSRCATHGIGVPEPRPRTHLRALLPGRPGPEPRHRRHGAGAGDRAPRRAGARWRGRGGVGRGPRLDVPADGCRCRRPTPAVPPKRRGSALMTDAPLILVVDDEQSYRDALRIALEREGFRVEVAADGAEAIARFDAVRPALVLLDVMLPRISGIDVCREIRTRSQVPIIMVTARNAEIDAVVGLEVGADDYVTKPFRLRELWRACAPRCGVGAATTTASRSPARCSRSATCASTPRATRSRCAGERVALPLKEFELLELLLANAGRVLTRDVLIDRVWGPNYYGDTKTLDVHVKRLRAKVEDDPGHPDAHRHRARRRVPLREGLGSRTPSSASRRADARARSRRGSGAPRRRPGRPGRRAPSPRSACPGRTGRRRRSPW